MRSLVAECGCWSILAGVVDCVDEPLALENELVAGELPDCADMVVWANCLLGDIGRKSDKSLESTNDVNARMVLIFSTSIEQELDRLTGVPGLGGLAESLQR